MPCYAIDGVMPVVHRQAFVHPTAVLIGDVVVDAGAYIGPLAVLRADFGGIRIGYHANVQDNCVIHGFPQSVTVVEDMGHIGHAAILHGCKVGKNAMIGMNSVILDDCEIGENAIIGANSTVTAKTKIPANTLALGSPAKIIRELRVEEIAWKTQGTQQYIELTQRCLHSLQEVMPLNEQDLLLPRKTYLDFHADHHTK
ncbi:transferase hexapeptide repeat family protein [Acinetobacter sp. ANC 4635]|uniref:gamma carbonic anhydrase family protein n=1 Tax=Acinetobacter sp. ANC 4635 TaxID=2529846 RepID=UPI00103AA0D6|nr:transferase hexapeptide repeat family protein [Acinetobacter sp. ANC 4635]TCB30154.1 transferase hexapeptide repeat family protein [Acinetobacter sp. ANC 4635]